MILITLVAVIGLFVLARAFFKWLNKDVKTTINNLPEGWPEGYPPNDPYATDSSASAFGGNCVNAYYFEHRFDE
jgi:hypothetical protein